MVKLSECSEGHEVLENIWNMKLHDHVYVNTDKTTLETAFLLSIRLSTTILFNP